MEIKYLIENRDTYKYWYPIFNYKPLTSYGGWVVGQQLNCVDGWTDDIFAAITFKTEYEAKYFIYKHSIFNAVATEHMFI